MSASPPRLFVPGDGAVPPALVGRSAAQAVLSRCLDDLVRGAAPPHNVVLVGPRGNGKTALLSWFKTMCGSASGVDVLWLTPGEIADGAGLLGIGRLDTDAARAALTKPLRAHDVGIEAQALETVVKDSQRYPYFLQLWGDALWQNHLTTGASELTEETVATVRPEVAAWMADYYQSRYRELRGGGLMSAALAVAPLFLRQNATASEQELDAALAATGREDAADRFATLESLNRLGYVWCPPGQGAAMAWSAGIPSLMKYVLDQAGPNASGGAP